MNTIRPHRNRNRVYCAGPLFNAAERAEMLAIAETLRGAGFETFVPHDDGMEFTQILPVLARRGWQTAAAGRLLHEAIFALDVYQVVVGCGSLLLNLNGRVPDEGAVSEAAMAWTLGKPIVIFKEDARTAISGRDNPLVVGLTRFETVAQIDDLADALSAANHGSVAPPEERIASPPHLAAAVESGERLWHGLEPLAMPRDPEAVADLVLELFATRDANRV